MREKKWLSWPFLPISIVSVVEVSSVVVDGAVSNCGLMVGLSDISSLLQFRVLIFLGFEISHKGWLFLKVCMPQLVFNWRIPVTFLN